jgi:hypothetical protein
MLARTFDQVFHSLLTLTRELFLILAVGILGSQLLIMLNGGPIEGKAQASIMAMGFIPVSSFEIDLDPANPAAVRSVYVHPSGEGVPSYVELHLSTTGESPKTYPCHTHFQAVWHCFTPGLRTLELKGFVVKE